MRERATHTVEFIGDSDGVELYPLLSQMLAIAHSQPVTVRFAKKSFTTPKLVVFDLDSTLVQAEFMAHIGERECMEQLVQLTHSALHGEGKWELNYRERVKLLKGMEVERLRSYYQELPLSIGAKELMAMLRYYDVPTAIISGAWLEYVQYIADLLLIDECFGSEWEERDGLLTGEMVGEAIGPEAKVRILEELARKQGVTTDEIVVIADGHNDLPMMTQAGCSYMVFTSQSPSPSLESIEASLRIDLLTT